MKCIFLGMFVGCIAVLPVVVCTIGARASIPDDMALAVLLASMLTIAALGHAAMVIVTRK